MSTRKSPKWSKDHMLRWQLMDQVVKFISICCQDFHENCSLFQQRVTVIVQTMFFFRFSWAVLSGTSQLRRQLDTSITNFHTMSARYLYKMRSLNTKQRISYDPSVTFYFETTSSPPLSYELYGNFSKTLMLLSLHWFAEGRKIALNYKSN